MRFCYLKLSFRLICTAALSRASLLPYAALMLASSGKAMESERWGRRRSRTWRASVRDRTHGGYLLGIITAPSREAAEEAAVRRFDLNGQQRARLWLIDLGPRPAQKRAVDPLRGAVGGAQRSGSPRCGIEKGATSPPTANGWRRESAHKLENMERTSIP
jgi:hypothetical protein